MTMDATNDNANKALLPAGMSDTLPPDAAHEATVVGQIMSGFASYGYDRVKPPLLEFEENLLRGPGEAMTSQTFRLMDPVSQRMMGLRADMTPQVARIAATRLKNTPRPLRLSYAGQILRVKGTQLRAARQFGQVGAELIGANTPAADAEVILMAASTLSTLGVGYLSIDLCLPTLIPALCRDLELDASVESAIRAALERKDAALITELGSVMGVERAALINSLLAATGPVDESLAALDRLDLGDNSKSELDTLKAVVLALRAGSPDLVLTVDVVENRGWEYHTGVTFTLFARDVRGELGAGGRYGTRDMDKGQGSEPATGLTLFMDTLLRAVPAPSVARRIFLPLGTTREDRENLRVDGWIVIPALADTDDAPGDAARQKCTHVFMGGKPIAL